MTRSLVVVIAWIITCVQGAIHPFPFVGCRSSGSLRSIPSILEELKRNNNRGGFAPNAQKTFDRSVLRLSTTQSHTNISAALTVGNGWSEHDMQTQAHTHTQTLDHSTQLSRKTKHWHGIVKSPTQWFQFVYQSWLLQVEAAHVWSLSTPVAATTISPTTNAHGVSSADSVHLQLNPQETQTPNSSSPPEPRPPINPPATNVTTLRVHTYINARTGKTYKAINTNKRKFLAFLNYNNITASNNGNCAVVTTKEYKFRHDSPIDQAQQERMRAEWRKLWKQRRLLTDRTEFLAVYPSDNEDGKHKRSVRNQNQPPTRSLSLPPVKKKRGGFADLLHLYRERLVAILEDERKDRTWTTREPAMVTWLQDHYGRDATNRLKAANMRLLSEAEQQAQFKEFLEWFRSYFPYFYDRCSACGASIKEEFQNGFPEEQHEEHPNQPAPHLCESEGDDADDSGYQTFMGYVFPAEAELKGKASRTELYQCHKCGSFTRFPRYNSAWHVMESRRGRCGEYSMLLFRFLRALNHEARWIVDWADHVWAEVFLQENSAQGEGKGRWVHLDPCEAAVDENLIYEGWGKKQTYILGFYAPASSRSHSHLHHPPFLGWQRRPTEDLTRLQTPLIQDITKAYTSEDSLAIQQRREESQAQVDAAIDDAVGKLKTRLVETGTMSESLSLL